MAEDPEAAPVWRADRPYRRWLVRRFPYAVFELGKVVTVVGGDAPTATTWLLGRSLTGAARAKG